MWMVNCPLKRILHAANSRSLSMKVLVNSTYGCMCYSDKRVLCTGLCWSHSFRKKHGTQQCNVRSGGLFQLWTLFNFQLFCGQSFQLLLVFCNLIHQSLKNKAKSGAENFLTSTLWGPFLQCEHQVVLPVKLNIMCA